MINNNQNSKGEQNAVQNKHCGNVSTEKITEVQNGWVMLFVTIFIFITSWVLIFGPIIYHYSPRLMATGIVSGVLLNIVAIVLSLGFFTLQPNEARVLILFGSYKGTVKKSGFHWGNPFYSRYGYKSQADFEIKGMTAESTQRVRLISRYKISLRARNLNGEILKVNDKRGNPIEIATVVVWRVEDTAKAIFDVDDYESYVRVQSESAVRHLASSFAYDHGEEDEITLRGGGDIVTEVLKNELQNRLSNAGVIVEEAWITHLAYAPEIASVMLKRQQAEAVIAARKKIVQGAVGMVEMALGELSSRKVIDLDDERKAAMVSNLMVVLCGESDVQPVVNTGTLYQ